MKVRYWALIDPTKKDDRVSGVFREKREKKDSKSLVLEYWSRDNRWVPNPRLLAYIAGGEVGAKPTSKKEAMSYIKALAGRSAEPRTEVPRLSISLERGLRDALLRKASEYSLAAGRPISMSHAASQILLKELFGKTR